MYVHPLLDDTDVCLLGQILRIHDPLSVDKEPTVDIQVYQRVDLVGRGQNKKNFGNQVYDEVSHSTKLLVLFLKLLQRRSFKSDQIMEEVDPWRIEGKAFAVHPQALSSQQLEEWLSYNDHFYVDQCCNSSRPSCIEDLNPLSHRGSTSSKPCYQARQQLLQENKRLLLSHQPLNGLELFAGAGGLSAGFDQSGNIETKWAVEMDANAALSYTYVLILHMNLIAKAFLSESTILTQKCTM